MTPPELRSAQVRTTPAEIAAKKARDERNKNRSTEGLGFNSIGEKLKDAFGGTDKADSK
jgi:hypothetical protein